MRSLFASLVVLFSFNSFAVESDVSCERIGKILDRIEEVSVLKFNHECDELKRTKVFFVEYADYKHQIDIDLTKVEEKNDKYIDQFVKFDERVVTGGLSYMNVIQRAVNESLGEEDAFAFRLHPTTKPFNKDYSGFYIMKKFLK